MQPEVFVEAVFAILVFFIPLALGWVVGQFFTFRGKWAERFNTWSIPVLLVVAFVAVVTLVFLSVLSMTHPYFGTVLIGGCGLIFSLLFLSAFMRWSKKVL